MLFESSLIQAHPEPKHLYFIFQKLGPGEYKEIDEQTVLAFAEASRNRDMTTKHQLNSTLRHRAAGIKQLWHTPKHAQSHVS